jgi:hypothetical protein
MLYMTLEQRAESMASIAASADGATEMMQAASLNLPSPSATPTPAHEVDPSINNPVIAGNGEVKEDDVDVILSKLDGKIYRQRNEQL